MSSGAPADPHQHVVVRHLGPAPGAARLTMILLHGRGASAEDILTLADAFDQPDVAYLAPQAAGQTWYPNTFLAPIAENEPALGSALRLIGRLIGGLEDQGIAAERIALGGFSQGACLALEFGARHARRYAAIAALSGGLIGPPDTPREYTGSFAGTPVFIGCSDVDGHIPIARVHESAAVYRRMGAGVDERIYPGLGHTVNREEVSRVSALLAGA
jgi:predicted esterase